MSRNLQVELWRRRSPIDSEKKTCNGCFSSNDFGPTAPGHLELTQHFEVRHLSLMPATNKNVQLTVTALLINEEEPRASREKEL